jgi:uncharacterized protein Yka (UPF0111/DUF47 family)
MHGLKVADPEHLDRQDRQKAEKVISHIDKTISKMVKLSNKLKGSKSKYPEVNREFQHAAKDTMSIVRNLNRMTVRIDGVIPGN